MSKGEIKAAAGVIACLKPGELDILVGPGQGLADGGAPHTISGDLVPSDLRRPNAQFTVIIDRDSLEITRIERDEEAWQHPHVLVRLRRR